MSAPTVDAEVVDDQGGMGAVPGVRIPAPPVVAYDWKHTFTSPMFYFLMGIGAVIAYQEYLRWQEGRKGKKSGFKMPSL